MAQGTSIWYWAALLLYCTLFHDIFRNCKNTAIVGEGKGEGRGGGEEVDEEEEKKETYIFCAKFRFFTLDFT